MGFFYLKICNLGLIFHTTDTTIFLFIQCVSGGCHVHGGVLCVLTEAEASCNQNNFDLKE